jgi:signal transduction histidine kinase
MQLLHKLSPKSLSGRLVLVLLGSVILLQIIAAMYLVAFGGPLHMRGEAYALALSLAQEIRVLDSLPPAERAAAAAHLNDRATSVIIVADRPVLAAPLHEHDNGGLDRILRQTLRDILGQQREFFLRAGGVGHYAMDKMYGAPDQDKDPRLAFTFPYALAVQLADGSWVQFTREVTPAEPNVGMLKHMLEDMWWRFLLLLILVLLVVRWVTRPLRLLAQAADALGSNLAQTPLTEEGPTETLRAIQAFNRMQWRIRQFVEERSNMLAAISHDLKTPVTRLRLRCDQIKPVALQQHFVADLDELRDMINRSLDFVRSIGKDENEVELDLNSLLESLRDDYAEIGQSVTLSGEAREPLPARPTSLKRCLMNLLDNAVRYGKTADVEIEDQGDGVVIAIRDQGPGISETNLPWVFEPFFRVEGSRSQRTGGHGLGLGIARNIVLQHGGDIRLKNMQKGGLEVLVTLPRRQLKKSRATTDCKSAMLTPQAMM